MLISDDAFWFYFAGFPEIFIFNFRECGKFPSYVQTIEQLPVFSFSFTAHSSLPLLLFYFFNLSPYIIFCSILK